MMTYCKLFWIFIKAQFCRIFLRKLNVSFIKVDGDWYCDIKGWPERFFPNALMVGDASRLIQLNSNGKDYVTFEVIPSRKKMNGENLIELTRTSSSIAGGGYYKTDFANADLSRIWLCPVTLFVLGRAVSVAAPAGAIIWLMANTSINGITLLKHCSDFLDPFARCMGLDGVILLAFILGFPANEIVIPIIIMTYMSQNTITDFESLTQLKDLFVQNGWTWITAVNTMIFSIMHWPCSTTVLTIKKETGSWKWTALAVVLPTLFGIICCMLFTSFANHLQ